MSETDLRARICADPGNLDLRLVYADQLLERGDPRGTFIAQQCELARLDVLHARVPSLLASTRRLEAAHVGTWLAGLGERHGADSVRAFDPVFEEGFLHRVALMPESVVAGWKFLSQTEPIDGLELIVVEALPAAQRGLTDGPNPRSLKVRADRWVTSTSISPGAISVTWVVSC